MQALKQLRKNPELLFLCRDLTPVLAENWEIAAKSRIFVIAFFIINLL